MPGHVQREYTHIEGACHCRNISYELTWPGPVSDMPVRECGCSFCTKHGGAWTSNPAAELNVSLSDRASVSVYQFGTGTARFHVCAFCGAVPFVTSEIDNQTYAVVNVNCFTSLDLAGVSRAPADFEGEALDDRLARRKRNWISNVHINEVAA